MNKILEVRDICYKYQDGSQEKMILDHVSMSFEKGKFYALLGESGSGKTTFLALIGGLDLPFAGKIYFKDKDINEIGLSEYRRKNVALIFQDYNLIPYMSVLDNLSSAMAISNNKADKATIIKVLKQCGLNEDILKQKANKLSGGEKQRVAIARAILSNCDVVLADEPTGNLDKKSSKAVIATFRQLINQYNKTIIMVTHNEELRKEVDESYYLDQDLKKFVCYEN